MGLDMYAYRSKQDLGNIIQVTDNLVEDSHTGLHLLCHWRKFNALHGWMEREIYEIKYEGTDLFNCIGIKIEASDLDTLHSEIEGILTSDRSDEPYAGKLLPVEGFFFGSQVIEDADLIQTRDFIRVAKEVISDGQFIYYDSWW